MNEVQFICNQTDENHLKIILKCFEGADEIWMATAFLKLSGLNLLIPVIQKHISKGKSIKIIAGKNFALTEPDALEKLYRLFEGKSKAQLYLDKAKSKNKVFHPKLFVFIKNNNVSIISGSSNITSGGLCNNEEFSMCFETLISEVNFLAIKEYFNKLISKNNADPCNFLEIERYRQYYEEQKVYRKRQKSIPDKNSEEYDFDYSKLKNRLIKYDLSRFNVDASERVNDYRRAKIILDEIANSTRLNQNRFIEIIDELVGKPKNTALWRSGGLVRHKTDLCNCKNEFRELVRFIKDHQNEVAGKVFIGAKKYVNKVYGARMNFVSEIMMTYQPNRFANLNSNPIKVLKEEAGFYRKYHSDSYNENDYNIYCDVIKEICRELDLKDMLEVDSFINKVYRELKNN